MATEKYLLPPERWGEDEAWRAIVPEDLQRSLRLPNGAHRAGSPPRKRVVRAGRGPGARAAVERVGEVGRTPPGRPPTILRRLKGLSGPITKDEEQRR